MQEEILKLKQEIQDIKSYFLDRRNLQNNDFQTAVIENVQLAIESGAGLGFGKRIAKDTPALIEVTSISKGIRFPLITTTQRDAIVNPIAGIVIFNTTTGVLNFHNGTVWGAV